MSEPLERGDGEIARVCSYLKDDQTVANYFGIPREHVERVRASVTPTKPRWLFRAPMTDGGNTDSYGTNSHLAAADEAEAGSRRLNERIQRLFRKWERIHGFREGAAQILLPNGYVPEQRREVA